MAKRKSKSKVSVPAKPAKEKSADHILFFEGLRSLRTIEDPDLKHLAGKALENIWLSLPTEDDILPSNDK
jgi:hypothetical protein